MIDISPSDVFLTRHASDGRFVLFTRTDVRPGWPLPWWGAVADTRGDGFGLLARIDGLAAPEGWTTRQLLTVARARGAVECGGRATLAAATVQQCLDRAVAAFKEPTGPSEADATLVTLESDGRPSPYPWTIARCGPFELPLCPDPDGAEEGITLEQLLIIVDQLLHDATRAYPHAAPVWICRRHMAAALVAKVGRAAVARGSGLVPPNSE